MKNKIITYLVSTVLSVSMVLTSVQGVWAQPNETDVQNVLEEEPAHDESTDKNGDSITEDQPQNTETEDGQETADQGETDLDAVVIQEEPVQESTQEPLKDAVVESFSAPVNRATTGWVKVENIWFYYNAQGVKTTGWQKIDDKWYYLDPNQNGAMVIGWIQIGNRKYYTDSNGVVLTGWQMIDNKQYYFKGGDSGLMLTGWQKIDNKWYYFGAANDGAMQTGWIHIGNKWYYTNSEGVVLTGWQKIGNSQYYFKGGDSGLMLTGWQKIDNKWYYFGTADDGVMKTGWIHIGSKWYYTNSEGVVLTGWQKIGNSQYYFKGGDSGLMLTGWQKIDNKWYYFGTANDGVMKIGWIQLGNRKYYTNSDGIILTGWQKIDNQWYYFKGGDSGLMLTGWIHLGNRWYYTNSDGVVQTGWQKINGKQYCFKGGDSGLMYTGWQKIDNKWYYFGTTDDGVMKTSQWIDGSYYVGENGAMYENQWVDEFYVGANGAIDVATTSAAQDRQKGLEVCAKIMFAVETGGQIYGNGDYADFTEPYTNSSSEHAITIGAGAWYGTEARTLLLKIRQADATNFNKLDTAGIGHDLDTANWSQYKLTKGSDKAKCIVAIISSDVGKRCQDQLMQEQMETYFEEAEALGVIVNGAKIEYANARHHAGRRVATDVVNTAKKPYTATTMYDAIMARNYSNGIGTYVSRQVKVLEWIRRYL